MAKRPILLADRRNVAQQWHQDILLSPVCQRQEILSFQAPLAGSHPASRITVGILPLGIPRLRLAQRDGSQGGKGQENRREFQDSPYTESQPTGQKGSQAQESFQDGKADAERRIYEMDRRHDRTWRIHRRKLDGGIHPIAPRLSLGRRTSPSPDDSQLPPLVELCRRGRHCRLVSGWHLDR